MSLIKKPSELEVNATISALVYGMPGSGKTTVGVSSPKPVLFDFDGGVNRIEAQFKVDTVQVHSWEEVIQALAEVEADPSYQTIVVDTIGKMMIFMEDYIKRVTAKDNGSLLKRDGTLSMKGYGERKQMFINFNNRLRMMGRHVVYIAHEKEEKQKFNNEELTVKRPEIPGSSINDLIKDIDLVGYLAFSGKDRVIYFDPQETFYAKNSCGLHGAVKVPQLEAGQENRFMTTVVEAFTKRLQDGQRLTAQYDNLKQQISDRVAAIESAQDANDVMDWVLSLEHVFNTKAFAASTLQFKATALGMKFNKATKKYEPAQ